MRRFGMLALLVTFLLAPATQADFECVSDGDKTINYDPYYGDYCGGWGNGCAECVNAEDGTWCVTNGESCVPRPVHRN